MPCPTATQCESLEKPGILGKSLHHPMSSKNVLPALENKSHWPHALWLNILDHTSWALPFNHSLHPFIHSTTKSYSKSHFTPYMLPTNFLFSWNLWSNVHFSVTDHKDQVHHTSHLYLPATNTTHWVIHPSSSELLCLYCFMSPNLIHFPYLSDLTNPLPF